MYCCKFLFFCIVNKIGAKTWEDSCISLVQSNFADLEVAKSLKWLAHPLLIFAKSVNVKNPAQAAKGYGKLQNHAPNRIFERKLDISLISKQSKEISVKPWDKLAHKRVRSIFRYNIEEQA